MEDGVSQNLSEINIKSKHGNYPIVFGHFNFNSPSDKRSFCLVDDILKNKFEFAGSTTYYLKADEKQKNLQSVEKVLIGLNSLGMKRQDLLSVVGGGYTQDIGTLVASIYMRGVDWVYFPTTLASMGDSCVGGKSSINAGTAKNLIGNFYPPSRVFIDVGFSTSLSDLDIVAGFAEIVKICFAKGVEEFSKAINLISLWEESHNPDILRDLVFLSIKSKKYFVEMDEFDIGIRRLLNFGHSFGHAIEVSSQFRIPHGVAVLIGMVAAVNHNYSITSRQTDVLVEFALNQVAKVREHIVSYLTDFDYVVFCEAILKDKKNSKSDMRLILPKREKLEIVAIPIRENALELARDAMMRGIKVVLNEIC